MTKTTLDTQRLFTDAMIWFMWVLVVVYLAAMLTAIWFGWGKS